MEEKKIEQISILLGGSLMAMGKVGLKMNVARENLGGVVLLLPSLKAPPLQHCMTKTGSPSKPL